MELCVCLCLGLLGLWFGLWLWFALSFLKMRDFVCARLLWLALWACFGLCLAVLAFARVRLHLRWFELGSAIFCLGVLGFAWVCFCMILCLLGV